MPAPACARSSVRRYCRPWRRLSAVFAMLFPPVCVSPRQSGVQSPRNVYEALRPARRIQRLGGAISYNRPIPFAGHWFWLSGYRGLLQTLVHGLARATLAADQRLLRNRREGRRYFSSRSPPSGSRCRSPPVARVNAQTSRKAGRTDAVLTCLHGKE